MEWSHEEPDQLRFNRLNHPAQIIKRGQGSGMVAAAERFSRVHARQSPRLGRRSGRPLHAEFAAAIGGAPRRGCTRSRTALVIDYPTVVDGARGVKFLEAALQIPRGRRRLDGLPARAARGMNEQDWDWNDRGPRSASARCIFADFFGSVGLWPGGSHRCANRLIALADTNLDLAREVRERYGWERISTDWKPGDRRSRHRDAFINSNPNDAHVERDRGRGGGEQAHLFSEKPLARTADGGFHDQASRACCGRPAHVCALSIASSPPCSWRDRMIADGEIGRIRHFRSNFLIEASGIPTGACHRSGTARCGGGSAAARDLGSHHIGQARFHVGEGIDKGQRDRAIVEQGYRGARLPTSMMITFVAEAPFLTMT